MPMWGYPAGYGWAGFIWMILGAIFWLGLLGLLVWLLVRWLGRGTGYDYRATPPPPQAAAPSALEILRQRYARGEIDEATYLRMREQLETPSPPPSTDAVPQQ
jgi:putative membrane protein